MIQNHKRESQLNGFTQNDCHVPCMGHVINLAVQSLLKTLKMITATHETQLSNDDEEVQSKQPNYHELHIM